MVRQILLTVLSALVTQLISLRQQRLLSLIVLGSSNSTDILGVGDWFSLHSLSRKTIRRVIPSAVEESPRSRPGKQRLQRAHSEEILRYTQDDSEEENKKSVILNLSEESPRSRPGQQRLQRAHSEEILRYTQDDSEEENKKQNK